MFLRSPTKYDDCSKLPEDNNSTPEKIALARCNCLIAQYLRWKKDNHQHSNRSQYTALIFTAITPVLLLISWDYAKLLGAATSAVATIATGLMAIYGWRENYIRYGYVWHVLQIEKYRYLTHATEEYSNSDRRKAASIFAGRIEQIVMTEVTDWRAEMQRVEEKNRNPEKTPEETPEKTPEETPEKTPEETQSENRNPAVPVPPEVPDTSGGSSYIPPP